MPGAQNRGMLRLAPSLPPLWRTASSVQLGADAVARIDDITGWQEQLLDALIDGIPDAMLLPLAVAYGAPAAEVPAFLARIGRALSAQPATPLPVRVELPADLGATDAEALLAALRGSDLDIESVTAWHADDLAPGAPVIAVAQHLLDPRRAARLMAADVTHLPVQLAGDRVTVGPLVVPGRSACLACVHAHRSDADPTWPVLAAQLLGRAPVTTDRALLIEAGLLVARLVRTGAVTPSNSVTVSAASGRRSWRAHRPHSRCLCRSPEGTATAAAPDSRSPAPTTATASGPRG